MRLEIQVKVTCEQFFNWLVKSIEHDIKMATGEEVKIEHVKSGYTYDKHLLNKLGQKNKTKVRITKLAPPYHYEAEFDTMRGKNIISYELKEQSLGALVTYEEAYKGMSNVQQLNHNILKFFYNRSSKKKIRYMVKQIEHHIIQSQSEKVEC